MISLEDYGWNDFHRENDRQSNHSNEQTGRVISVQGFKYHLITATGEMEAELAGRVLYGSSPEQLPKTGDWVHYLDYGSGGYIIECLPRQNELVRKTPGKKSERQVLATNIDIACIVQGLDRDFNLKRLDRYLAQVQACGIEPVVVLNKADLVDDAQAFVREVQDLRRDVRVVVCSTLTHTGMESVRALFEPRKTYMLIGSSGVGKSSLLNALMEGTVQSTGAVSDFNNKGRHTTSSRELFLLPNGSLLMDTPGMREFGVTDEQSGDTGFPAIDALSAECRFSDCTHSVEEGCAVLRALESGSLDAAVYDSYVKLEKERRRFGIRAEDKKRMARQFGKMTREAKEHRRRYKY